jgi:hypothetical protein
MFEFQVKPNFTVASEQAIATAPTVDFGNTRPASPAQPGSPAPASPPAPPDAPPRPATK